VKLEHPPPTTSSLVLPTRGIWGPLLVAFLAEGLILAAAAFWLSGRLSPPQTVSQSPFGPIQLDLTKLPTPEPASAAPPPLPQITKSKPPPSAAPPKPEVTTTQDLSERPLQQPESDDTPTPEASPQDSEDDPAPAPLPDLSLLPRKQAAHIGPEQAAPQWANGQSARLPEFYKQLNEALRSAARYLAPAHGMKLSGRVYIVVHYRDGRVWGPRILRSSGFAVLDQAALEVVTRAVWPPPPPGLKGREFMVPIFGSFW
jgi:periplasmic protein TonB